MYEHLKKIKYIFGIVFNEILDFPRHVKSHGTIFKKMFILFNLLAINHQVIFSQKS